MISVWENFLVESEFLQNKICPYLAQDICIIYVGHFYMKHSWTNSLSLSEWIKNPVCPAPWNKYKIYILGNYYNIIILWNGDMW